MFRRALISVSNKSGLVDFVRPLVNAGCEIVSTGGTARFLRENDIPVVEVSQVTGFPEILEGRVKTLHPMIHMALLARGDRESDRRVLEQFDVRAFDLVVVNLYPFAERLAGAVADEELVESIDVGGPTMLRAAAKNFGFITVVTDPRDYGWVARRGETTVSERRALAAKVFDGLSNYDGLIGGWLRGDKDADFTPLTGRRVQSLRYGENPQQSAVWYAERGGTPGLQDAQLLQGKPLSFNNLLDLDAAVRTVQLFGEPCAVAVKHLNPCGVGRGFNAREAVDRCVQADPLSVFGGIVAVNRPVDEHESRRLAEIFLECIIAPAFTTEAMSIFQQKPNMRVLAWPNLGLVRPGREIRSIAGGFLLQTPDAVESFSPEWVRSDASPTPARIEAINLAWRVCSQLKSNAIAIADDQKTLGLGMGQVNRVDSVRLAIERWRKHHPTVQENVVLASDAFFPFADSVEILADAGIRWVVQPGGSMKDEAVFKAARERGVEMLITGRRHFRH